MCMKSGSQIPAVFKSYHIFRVFLSIRCCHLTAAMPVAYLYISCGNDRGLRLGATCGAALYKLSLRRANFSFSIIMLRSDMEGWLVARRELSQANRRRLRYNDYSISGYMYGEGRRRRAKIIAVNERPSGEKRKSAGYRCVGSETQPLQYGAALARREGISVWRRRRTVRAWLKCCAMLAVEDVGGRRWSRLQAWLEMRAYLPAYIVMKIFWWLAKMSTG